jgi:hypothetical protein
MFQESGSVDPGPLTAAFSAKEPRRNNLVKFSSCHEAPHYEIDDDGRPMLEVIVPESLRARTADALARAEKILKEPEPGEEQMTPFYAVFQ